MDRGSLRVSGMQRRSNNWTSSGVVRRKKTNHSVEVRRKKNSGFFAACREFFWLFTDSSSIHGLRYLSPTLKLHPLERGLWYGAVLLAIYGVVSLNTSTLKRFFMNPTVISMEHNYKEWNTSFPSVTICPAAKYNEAEVLRLVNTQYSHVRDKEALIEFFQGLANSTFGKFAGITGGLIDPKPSKYWRVVKDISFPFLYNLSNSNVELYNQVELNPVFTEVGICYSYNSVTTIYNDPKAWESNNWNYIGHIKLFEGSPLDGDIFAQVMNMNSGYGLYLLAPGEFPHVSIPQILGGNNTYKTLDLTALSIVSSPEVEALPVRQRRCRLPWESDLHTSPVYSYNLCRMECRMKACQQRCGCVPFFYRPTERFPVCGPEGMKCLDKYSDLLIKMIDPETGKKIPCDCLQLCNEVNYVIDNDNTMEWTLGTNLKWGLIKYPKFRLKRDILFGKADLMVSIGGTAGLFLGCSILSFAEVLYFFSLRLFLFACRRQRGK